MHQKGNWTSSIIPRGDNHNICLVLDDLGRNGRVISAFALAILLTVAVYAWV
jgi:hypothetical protein